MFDNPMRKWIFGIFRENKGKFIAIGKIHNIVILWNLYHIVDEIE